MTEALPSNIGFGTVTGRFGSAVLNAGDADGYPDFMPFTTGWVTFTPTVTSVKDKGATPPVTMTCPPIKCSIDPTGYLLGGDGNRGVHLIASYDPDLDPFRWTYTVSFSPNIGLAPFSISLDVGEVKDLATCDQVVSSTGIAGGVSLQLSGTASLGVAAAVSSAGVAVGLVTGSSLTHIDAGISASGGILQQSAVSRATTFGFASNGVVTIAAADTVMIGTNTFPLGGVNLAAKVVGGITEYTAAFGPTIPVPPNTYAGILQIEVTCDANGYETAYFDRAASYGSGGAGLDGRSLVPTPIPASGFVLVGDLTATPPASGTGTGANFLYDYARGPNIHISLVKGQTPPPPNPPNPATGTWLSGGSGNGIPDGSFGVWRGTPTPIATSWNDDTPGDQVAWSQLPPGHEYGSFVGSMDIAPGAIFSGESWAAAAGGAYDSRWTSSLQTALANWNNRGQLYIRFAHEMNGNWYPWGVSNGDQGNFIAGWRRFRALQQSIFPAAKMVFGTNGNSVQAYNWESLWPGDQYVDVYSTDWYSNHWAMNATFDGFGGPVGIEQHRQFAQAHGKPMGISEWGMNHSATGDQPNYIQYMHDFFTLNGGTGAGNVLYECLFNVQSQNAGNFGLYPTSQSPNSALKYQQLF